jgi:DNA-binding CsgD family transcriptional regulator/methanogenic corrinoid protein MtbC1
MYTATAVVQTRPQPDPAQPVLICAPRADHDEPPVVLADVLRLPLDATVTPRPLRRFDTPPAAHSVVTEQEERLVRALLDGDLARAHALAGLLWQDAGIEAVYRTMSDCLSQLASSWADGTGSVLAEHRATRTASVVAERLRAQTPPATRCGTVVLAVPPGDRHTFGLTALAHLVQDAGWRVLLVDDLPLAELAEVTAEPGTIALVLSAHTTLSAAASRALLNTLREAAPDVLLVLGGPGVSHVSCPSAADLVTDKPDELLRALDERSSALTVRERQVLLAVADGSTNAEIAELLGIAPATVKTHMDHIFNKTSTVHRAAAVARALRRGWIQ